MRRKLRCSKRGPRRFVQDTPVRRRSDRLRGRFGVTLLAQHGCGTQPQRPVAILQRVEQDRTRLHRCDRVQRVEDRRPSVRHRIAGRDFVRIEERGHGRRHLELAQAAGGGRSDDEVVGAQPLQQDPIDLGRLG